MWVRLCILWTLLWVARGAPSAHNVCPEYCKCYPLEGRQLEAHCSSQEFLDKIGLKQIAQIVSLNLKACAIKHIDHKLKKLHNLRKLDLSDNFIEDLKKFPSLPKLKELNLKGNAIQHLTAAELPKSLENLDVSFNNITYIAHILDMLPNLKELDLNNNLVSCECEFLKERDYLLWNGVNIVRPVSCYSPPIVKGKSLFAVYCSEGNVMYDELLMPGDEPDVGSGDLNARPTFDDGVDGSSEGNLEEDYIMTNNEDVQVNARTRTLVEGSGEDRKISFEEDDYRDYGSGDIDITSEPTETAITEGIVHACYFNCSTPSPSKIEETNIGSPTNVLEELGKIFKELTGQTEITTASTSTVETEEEITTEPVIVKADVPLVSSINERAKTAGEGRTADKSSVKSPTQTDEPKELEKQAQEPKQSNTTFIIVAVLLVLMAGLIVYAVVKRRSNRQNQNNRRPNVSSEDEKNSGVEMKALIPPKPPTNEVNNLPEKTPLMNGQNGTPGNKEAEEPELVEEIKEPVQQSAPDLQEPDGKTYPKDSVDGIGEDVVVRPKRDDENLLTPETKRVTIQVKELSSPKTPVFVHRVLSDDGRIITTPSLEQRN